MLLRGWDDIIKAYHTYMVNVGMFFGANKTQAENDFANVLLFEMMLANVSLLQASSYLALNLGALEVFVNNLLCPSELASGLEIYLPHLLPSLIKFKEFHLTFLMSSIF